MTMPMPSIFNDILGPIMLGPSSSHTCAPARIGFLSGQLVESGLRAVEVSFLHGGSFTHSYRGQRSDLGFIGGALGFREDDARLRDAYAEARRAGVDVSFVIGEGTPAKPNLVSLRLTGRDGKLTVVEADSTGGGTLELYGIDGFQVDIRGDAYEVLVCCRQENEGRVREAVDSLFPVREDFSCSANTRACLFNVKLRERPDDGLVQDCRSLPGAEWVRLLDPVHPVLLNRTAVLPPSSAGAILAAPEGASLGELGVRYEMARAGWDRQQVEDRMDRVMTVMEAAAEAGAAGTARRHGILEPKAASVLATEGLLDLGVLNTAVPWAMGLMEMNSDMGLVVGGPTGGSAGIIPGVVLGVAKRLGATREAKRAALFAAGMTGVVFTTGGCTYSAELSGCQVEVGAASALAAAGLVELLGGTPRQALNAAATSIHNILGLICDPVAGLVEVPCISRNTMGVANAAVCARLALGGYDPLIGLDESIRVMLDVGNDLPSKLRCTGRGGLCDCVTGKQLLREQQDRDTARRV